MRAELTKKAVALSERTQHCFISTVGESGIPHVAAAKRCAIDQNGDLVLTDWFCPATIDNIMGDNQHVSVVIWDKDSDEGYQLVGELKKEEEVAFLDGYSPEVNTPHPVPQILRKLTVVVRKISEFNIAPHTDAGIE